MIAAYQEQLSQAAEQLRFLKRAMFGQRREHYIPSPDQRNLFTPEAIVGMGPEPVADEAKPLEESPATTSTKHRARRPRIEFPQYLEHRRTEYLLPETERPCSCRGAKRTASKLAEAIDYVLDRWAAFVRYTSDGRISIDNNVIE